MSVQERFEELAKTLEEDALIGLDSTGRRMRDHPARAEIVRMGPEAVPLILERIRKKRRLHWHQTLREITGEDPVPREDWGKIQNLNQAWLAWAERKETGE